MPFFFLATLFLGLTSAALADPLNESMELGASVSHSYDARNVLVNPAALGFQTQLNGGGPLTSFAYGVNRGRGDELAGSIALGYFGFGLESLSNSSGKFRRYNFGIGVPLGEQLFFGLRYLLHRPETFAAGNFSSLDAGLQWRPSAFFSVGFLTNRLNRPDIAGVQSPMQYILGATVRPTSQIELGLDVDTLSRNFAQTFGYQATLGFEPVTGIHLRVGYHRDYHWQMGMQWSFGNVEAFSTFQPGSDSRRLVMGIQIAPLPHPSPLRRITALKIDVDSSLDAEGKRGGLFSPHEPSLLEVLSRLEAARNQGIKLIVVKLESFPLGLASAQELFEALARVREHGARVEVFLGNAGMKEYLIASAANAIHIEPSASIGILGFKAESYFLKGTLEKLGVEGEFLARSEYKSAPEMFTRRESSPVNREALLEELKEAETQFLPMLARYRKITPEKWKAILNHAIYSADEAKTAGLVDSVASYPAREPEIEKSHLVRESLAEHSHRLNLPPRIAVIYANGDILQQRVGLLSLGGRSAVTPERVESHFKTALSDPRIKAIVFRINSGGGEILASERIAETVEKAQAKKPVIISMGDAAASGGYMIAAPGQRIFADPLTLTGSIGVFLGKFSFAGTYKWLQLHKEILSHAPYPGLFSEHQPWSAAEREILKRRTDQYYEKFVSYVASHRHLTPAAAEAGAKGRVWLGATAAKLKLVDDLGGFTEAIDYAANSVGLRAGDYERIALLDGGGLLGFLGTPWWMASEPPSLASALPRETARQVFWLTRLQETPYLYLSEYDSF